MQKIKSINFSKILGLIKCSLIGVAASLIGTLIFAFVLKFTNLSSSFIETINNTIRAVSLFVALTCAKKRDGKMLVKALFIAVIYSILTLFIFGIINGGIRFDMGFLYDLIFSVVASVALAVIINLLSKKSS